MTDIALKRASTQTETEIEQALARHGTIEKAAAASGRSLAAVYTVYRRMNAIADSDKPKPVVQRTCSDGHPLNSETQSKNRGCKICRRIKDQAAKEAARLAHQRLIAELRELRRQLRQRGAA